MRSVKALALAPSEKETSSAEARLESPCVPFDINTSKGIMNLASMRTFLLMNIQERNVQAGVIEPFHNTDLG